MLRIGQGGSWPGSHALILLQPASLHGVRSPEAKGMCPLGVYTPLLDPTLGSQGMGLSSSTGPSLYFQDLHTRHQPVCAPLAKGRRKGSCLERVWLKLGHRGELFPCMYMRPLVVWNGAVFVKRRRGGCISIENSKEYDHSTTELAFRCQVSLKNTKEQCRGGRQ